nr:ferredoxin family protein [Granulosicoccus sp.]
CVRVCPYSVFSVAKLEPETRRGLSLRGKIKGWAHGWKQAVVLHPDQCHACGLCVAACPEKALKLRKVSDDA